MPTKLWNVTVCKLTCDRCNAGDEVRADGIVPKSLMYGESVETLGWRVKGHRHSKPDEAVCPDCVAKEIAEKDAKKKALAKIAADRRAANDEFKAHRQAVISGAQIVEEET